MRIQSFSPTLAAVSLLFVVMAAVASADIVFISDRDGSIDIYESDIYAMSDAGGHARRLTHDSLYKVRPKWSPDGRSITFSVDLNSAVPGQEQQTDVFLMKADGTRLRNLTQHPALDGNGAWSPDGRSLAFVSARSGDFEIHVMDIATGAVKQLTDSTAVGGYATGPAWSPDGRQIAYQMSLPGQGRHIYLMDATGERNRPLVKALVPAVLGKTFMSHHPRWSPDGEYLLYTEREFDDGPDLFKRVANRLIIRRRDGSHPRVLAIPETWRVGGVCWAADGTAVLFDGIENGLVNREGGNYEIYRYELSTRQITNLTQHPSDDWAPDWTSQGLSVAPAGKITTQWGRIKMKRAPGEPSSRLLVPAGASHR